MNPEEYSRMFELEDRYWWFVGRRGLALRLFDSAAASPRTPPGALLDLGCGTGVVLRELEERGFATGLDMSVLALDFCRKRGLSRLVQADGTAMPISTDTVRAIVALDVFEHIENDSAAFAESYRALAPGGLLVLS